MDILQVSGVKIAGIVGCIPENVIDNRDACAQLYKDGVDTLIKATGIVSRAIADAGTTTLDLCVSAANEVLSKTETEPDEIGAVVCVTFTPEHLMPADAPSAQSRLGLPNNTLAFDVNMACSGYGYGLYLGSLLTKQLNKKVLVLDGDVQSAFTSKEDKATMPVLADAGTATLLQPGDENDSWHFAFYTDGSKRDVLFIPAGGAKRPTQKEDLENSDREDGGRRKETEIYMNGFEIFRFVSVTASHFILDYMAERGLTPDDVDIFVPHQANIYMIGQLTKKLKIDVSKMWKSGDVYGNPSSASVPLTIAKNASEWFSKMHGVKTLFAGFGGGLSISVGDIALNESAYYNVIQYKKQE